MFGFNFDKPATPQAKDARDFVRRNKSRFDNLQALSDAELEQLQSDVDSLVAPEALYQMHTVDSELSRTYFAARESIKAERMRRQSVMFDAWLTNQRAKGAVGACLRWLATYATGAESIETAKALALTADDLLGQEPPTVAKVSKAAAAKMTDEELVAAMRAAREQSAATAPFVNEADAIQMALDYLTPIVRDLKRRQSLLASCRKQGEANYKVLEAEESERKSRNAESAAKLEELTRDTPAVLAKILERLDSIEGAS